MLRTFLRQTLALATSLAVALGLFVGVGLWRKSEDSRWCRQVVANTVTTGAVQPGTPDLNEQTHTACVVQRRRQRQMFGAVWRSGGERTAECGFEVARLQLVSDQDPEARRAILERFGFDPSTFDSGSRVDQDRLVQACQARGHEAR